jgi:hypothetical protein
MAELSLMTAAINFVIASARFAAKASKMAKLDIALLIYYK